MSVKKRQISRYVLRKNRLADRYVLKRHISVKKINLLGKDIALFVHLRKCSELQYRASVSNTQELTNSMS